MPALLLCELPAGATEARSRILDKVSLLAIRGEAGVKFIGTEHTPPGQPDRSLLAIAVASVDLARTLHVECRNDAALPTSLKIRVLDLEPMPAGALSAPLFP
jgi:hypothetical protein